MANWCVGDLKVRGTKKHITNFLLQGLIIPEEFNSELRMDDSFISIKLLGDNAFFKFKYTKENFSMNNLIDIYFDSKGENEEIECIVIEEYYGKNKIDVKGLQKLSQEFNVDFRIHGFERGKEFNQLVEIINGKVKKNKKITFENYMWDCIAPLMGG